MQSAIGWNSNNGKNDQRFQSLGHIDYPFIIACAPPLSPRPIDLSSHPSGGHFVQQFRLPYSFASICVCTHMYWIDETIASTVVRCAASSFISADFFLCLISPGVSKETSCSPTVHVHRTTFVLIWLRLLIKSSNSDNSLFHISLTSCLCFSSSSGDFGSVICCVISKFNLAHFSARSCCLMRISFSAMISVRVRMAATRKSGLRRRLRISVFLHFTFPIQSNSDNALPLRTS